MSSRAFSVLKLVTCRQPAAGSGTSDLCWTIFFLKKMTASIVSGWA